MKINVLHILEGLHNSIFVNEEVEKIAQERYNICKECPSNSKNYSKLEVKPEESNYYSKYRPDEHCVECACNIHAKIRSLHTACDLNKWSEVATPLEAAKIASALDENINKD
jgi:hypothetical protein